MPPPHPSDLSAGGFRKQQLGYQRPGSHSGLHDDPRCLHDVRPVLHEPGRGCRRHIRPISVQVVFGNNNWATNAQGVTPDYMTIRDASMMYGQFFTSQDVDAAAKSAVLGETVAQNLFGDSDPTGQVVIIKNVPFTVVGVLSPKGQSPTGQDQDDVILLPISTAMQKVLGANRANAQAVGSLTVQAISRQARDY